MKVRRTALAVAAALATVAVATTALGSTQSAGGGGPITIGYAFDSKGNMGPFDGPALAAAKLQIAKVNKAGGVTGRKLKLITCDTQNNKPAVAKSCAARMFGQGAQIMFTTCDVDFATPVVQESIKRGVLAISPCIGTDQMGPKRFGQVKGKLAFSFGNVAQDEGAAMAEFAYKRKGWRNAAIATNNLLVYFKNVTAAFEDRFTELGGKIVAQESYTTGNNDVGTAVGRLNAVKADVVVTSTAFGELPGLVQGLRTLGNKTPILNSWAGDGTYWLPKGVDVSEYYAVTYASIFGDDPNADVKSLIAGMTAAGAPPGTGGFVTGAAMVDGVVAAIKRAKGSTKGSDLAAQLEKFKKVKTVSGAVSFSPKLHSVFGRGYRIIQITDNKAKFIGIITATSPAKILTLGEGVAESTTDAHARRPGGTLRAADVSRAFEGVQALQGVTLELHRHEVVGLIGPNGAGKSTLVNLLSGFDRPTSGLVEFEGRDITRWSASRRGRHGLARTFQHGHAFGGLTVRENVEVAALGVGARGGLARRRAAGLLDLLGLAAQAEHARPLARARRRAPAGRCPRARDRASLRADGRARCRPARGRGSGIRRGRSQRARRARGRRAADRSQHGPDHGRLRPHPRARSGPDAGRREPRRDPGEPRRHGRLPR